MLFNAFWMLYVSPPCDIRRYGELVRGYRWQCEQRHKIL